MSLIDRGRQQYTMAGQFGHSHAAYMKERIAQADQHIREKLARGFKNIPAGTIPVPSKAVLVKCDIGGQALKSDAQGAASFTFTDLFPKRLG